MTWMRGYLGSVAMALLLATLTWAWLYSESTAHPMLQYDFRPRIGMELASIRYEVNGREMEANRLRLEVSGPRGIVETLRPVPCDPVIPDGLFSQDRGSFVAPLRREDFRLPASVQIKEIPQVTVHYVKFVERPVGVDARATDADDPPPGWRVTEIRPNLTEIHVKLPADRVDDLPKKLPIQKVRVGGHTSTFETAGYLQLPGPKMSQKQDLRLEVVIKEILDFETVKNVVLRVARPPRLMKHRLAFKGAEPMIDVKVEGPPDVLKKVTAQHLYPYVRVDRLTDSDIATGGPFVFKEEDLGCDVSPEFRTLVRVVTIMSNLTAENRQVEIVVEK